MKNFLKYIGILGLCIFSFYYTDKVARFVKSRNPVMQGIKKLENGKYLESQDSLLIGNMYIVPGLNGRKVDIDKSFNKMKNSLVFNEEDLVFEDVTPRISLENNKNRIIIRGNEKKEAVSIILEEDNDIAEFLISNNYKFDMLIKTLTKINKYELINNSSDINTYKKIDNYLNKNNSNSNLCYVDNKDFCNNKYIFKESIEISKSNLLNIRKIKSGDIILIRSGVSIDYLIILLKEIEYQDLDIIFLSDLISEKWV